MRELYCAVDLHSNNGYYGIVDKSGKRVFGRRIPNDLDSILAMLLPMRDEIAEIAIESTFNWYWLADGLTRNGFGEKVKLANPAAMEQYSGLKNTNDKSDAYFIAELSRLGILPTGYIQPEKDRFVRDILRSRSLFVKQRTAQILSLQNLINRQSGHGMSVREIQRTDSEELIDILGCEDNMFIAAQNLDVIGYLSRKISLIEKYVLAKAELKPEFEKLLTMPGIGKILGLTIMYETGDISRFPKAGNYTSYCRCVKAEASSNNKRKGHNNRKNGNKYLSWAFVEGAHKMRQFSKEAASFHDRKLNSSGCATLAVKALAAKMTKGVYYILKRQEGFDVKRMFG